MAEQARKRSKKRKPPLDPGDEIEFRVSTPVAMGRETQWVTFGTVGRVRQDEDPSDAARRIEDFVDGEVEDYIDALLEDDE